MKIVKISSGHSKYVSGAVGLVNEVNEARKLVDKIAVEFNERYKGSAQAKIWHDNTSRTQRANINAINKWHASSYAARHYSIHLNSSGATANRDIGVEVLYRFNQDKKHAEQLAANISKLTNLKNRGAKMRTDLGFLNKQGKLLIEAYFVNSKNDVAKMDEEEETDKFVRAVVDSIADELNLTPVEKVKYRIKSGQFESKENMLNAIEEIGRLKIASEKWIQINKIDDKFYFITGVYSSKKDAELAIEKMIQHKIVSKAHLVKV